MDDFVPVTVENEPSLAFEFPVEWPDHAHPVRNAEASIPA